MRKINFNNEKRLYPRIDTNLPLKVIANGYDFSTSTENLSCLGAYCHIDKYVPPFTKLSIKLDLPNIGFVECKGVIVRTEDNTNTGGFNIAIFFNRIDNQQRQKISEYLKQFLPVEANASL